MSVKVKMISCFSALIFLIFCVSAFSYWKISSMNTTYTEMSDLELPGIYATSELQQAVVQQSSVLRQYAINPISENKTNVLKENEGVDQKITELENLAESNYVLERVATIKEQQKLLDAKLPTVIEAIEAGDKKTVAAFLITT